MRERGAGHDGVGDDFFGVDQYAQQCHERRGESGGRQCGGRDLQGDPGVHADEPDRGRRGQEQRCGDVSAARHHRAVHPARVGGEQEAQEESREDREQHQERMRPDRRHGEVEREQRRAGVARDEMQAPPAARGQQAREAAQERDTVRCGSEDLPASGTVSGFVHALSPANAAGARRRPLVDQRRPSSAGDGSATAPAGTGTDFFLPM